MVEATERTAASGQPSASAAQPQSPATIANAGAPAKPVAATAGAKQSKKDDAKAEAARRAREHAEFEDAIATLRNVNGDMTKAADLVKEFNALQERATELQDKVKTISLRTHRELGALEKSSRRVGGGEDAQLLRGAVNSLERRLEHIREIRPETRSFFSRVMLGRVNVKCFSDRERVRLRDEYNKFKVRTNLIFILFPLVVLVFHYYLRHEWLDTHWINIFHHIWLLYYYVSLALRENILLVNGSNILPWWIYHHYVSAVGVMVLLVWPLTDIYLSYVPYVTCLCLYTGLVQAMQIVFYSRRDYASRALGKTGHMDVSYPETLTELPKELLILVPFLFVAHVWQVVLGLSLFRTLFTDCDVLNTHWTEFREELQVGACGVIGLVLGGGNFASTVLTVYSKANKRRNLMLRKEEAQQLDRLLETAAQTLDDKKRT